MITHVTYRRRHTLPLLTVLALMIALLASCGSSRKGVGASGEYPAGTTVAWSDLSVPVTVNLTAPRQLKAGGTLSMQRDRYIHLSLRFLGMEVGAAYITPDSVYAYSKLQRVYVAEGISDMLGSLDIPFTTLQDLLIGAPFTLPAGVRVYISDFTTLPATGQPLGIIINRPGGAQVSVSFSPAQDLPLAESTVIEASGSRNALGVSLDYNWQRSAIDTGASRLFSIPAGYSRIDSSRILKMLSL